MNQPAKWIWRSEGETQPRNAFTWFRRVVTLEELPSDACLRLAANSNTRLIINGQIVARKVSRYTEERITCDVVKAGPWLKRGSNVILALHHNWGPIITFQRTGNSHAGLYLSADWLATDASWKWAPATEMLDQPEQIIGVVGSAPRLRYGLQMDLRRSLGEDPTGEFFDDSDWKHAAEIPRQPWSSQPPDPAETRRQREYFFPAQTVVNAGESRSSVAGECVPSAISAALRKAEYRPDTGDLAQARALVLGGAAVLSGRSGTSRYLTLGFHQPVHGYPSVEIESDTDGVFVDVVYAEVPRLQFDGRWQVREDGWLDPESVVGTGYTDRVYLRKGTQAVEIPDERTARWVALHFHFPSDAVVRIARVGMVKSQYTINQIGTFECGDPQVDRIVRLMLMHAEVTMTDCYVDTPGREDGQWIEDSQLRAVIAARWFGDHSLRQFLLRTHMESQLPNGNTHPFAPSNYPVGSATYDWSMQWVTALFDEYEWTGDSAVVSRYWEALCRYMDLLLGMLDEEGLWRTNHLLADIRLNTIPRTPSESSGVVVPMLHEKLRQAAVMAGAVGQEKEREHWATAAGRLAKAFQKYFVVSADEEGGVARIRSVHSDDTTALSYDVAQSAHTIAAYSGLLSPDMAAEVVDHAFMDPDGAPPAGMSRWNNPTWFYRSLRAMSSIGRNERAIRHLKQRCAPYVPGHAANAVPLFLQGPLGGPLPEYWIGREDLGLAEGEINSAQPDDDTGSHGWMAVPLAWLHEFILGVTLLSPGGGIIRVAPDHAGLPYLAGWTMTPRGPVHVYMGPGDHRLEILLPANVEARVVIPPAFHGKRVRMAEDSLSGQQDPAGGTWDVTGPGRFVLECW